MDNELLPYKNIRIGVSVRDWEEAVRASGKVLLEEGSITQEYIEDMIKTVHELGPYMALMPGFALAHAAPSEAVLRNSASLITLAEPVEFGNDKNDPISVILCISCTDHDSHVDRLKIIAEKLMLEGMIETLAGAESAECIYQKLNA